MIAPPLVSHGVVLICHTLMSPQPPLGNLQPIVFQYWTRLAISFPSPQQGISSCRRTVLCDCQYSIAFKKSQRVLSQPPTKLQLTWASSRLKNHIRGSTLSSGSSGSTSNSPSTTMKLQSSFINLSDDLASMSGIVKPKRLPKGWL